MLVAAVADSVLEMKFLWQTCVSSSGTTLDIAVKYRDAGGDLIAKWALDELAPALVPPPAAP